MKMKKFWEFKNAVKGTGDLYIYGDIVSYKWDDSDTTAKSFKEDLEDLGDIQTLNVYVNSPGGSVFQGQAIYSILKRQKARVNVYVDGIAASIASVIAMAGDVVYMPANAMMMVHNPWTLAFGNAADFRKMADDLDKTRESLVAAYLGKVKISEEKLSELMDEETWLTAQECHEYGFCDEVLDEEKEIAASINAEMFAKYKNTPNELLQALQSKKKPRLSEEERQQLIADSKANIDKITNILGGM
jgi:ATP-dependent Clp protease protease subunit